MKIMPIISANAQITNNRSQIQTSSQPSFEGFRTPKVKGNSLQKLREDLASQLFVNPEDIAPLTKSLHSSKTAFVSQLIRRFAKGKDASNQELGQAGLEKVKEVLFASKDITHNHISLIKHSNYNIDELRRIYDAIADSPEKNELLGKLIKTAQNKSSKTEIHPFAMKEYLEMKQAPELNKNFELYRPFIEAYSDYPHAAKMLVQELEKKSYNPEYYQKFADVTAMKKNYSMLNLVDEKVLTENYSHEGLQILGRIDKEYSQKAIYSNSQPEFLTSIYRTTTQDNVQIRDAVVKKFVRPVPSSQVEEKASIETLDYIFNSIDYRPEVRKFIENAVDNDIAVSSPEVLSEIISNVDLNRVNKNIPNLKRIVSQNKNNSKMLIKELNENIDNTKYLKKRGIKLERQKLRDSQLRLISPIKYSFKKAVLNFKEKLIDILN